ncbi:MAG: GAF domain-containing protein [Candidatus Saliniplasma sp.]
MNYRKIIKKVEELLGDKLSKDEKLRAICRLLVDEVEHYDWVGFYLVEKGRLVLGPYVGDATEHTEIDFGEGICGQAADREETFTVQDVSLEDNYLSCSPKVRSEIVIPIFKEGKVAGELDIDSHVEEPFTDEDEKLLEDICEEVADIL